MVENDATLILPAARAVSINAASKKNVDPIVFIDRPAEVSLYCKRLAVTFTLSFASSARCKLIALPCVFSVEKS
jgi:hypothetical protein